MENSSPPHVRPSRMLEAVSPSSPRSDSVEKALARHRKALEEIRNSNLDTVPALNLDTKVGRVVFEKPELHARKVEGESRGDSHAVLWGLVTWTNPAGSLLAVVAGTFVYAFLRSGSMTSMICYALLSRIGWHVLGGMISSKSDSRSRLVASKLVQTCTAVMASAVSSLAKLHDDYIVTSDTRRSVAVCSILWVLSAIGRHMDLLQLVYVAYLLAFVVPNARSSHVTGLLKEATLRLKQATPSALSQMNTKQRRLSIAAVAASLWLAFDWPNRLVGLLMALLCVRMTMSQAEVEKLRDQTAPLTMSVKKKAARMSRRVSMYLGEFGTATDE